MPNRQIHANVGMTAAAIAAAIAADRAELRPEHALPEILGAAVGGRLGGLLPDALEPATSPNHRKRAHALTTGGALAIAARSGVPKAQLWCHEQAERLATRRAEAALSHSTPLVVWVLALAEFVMWAAAGFVMGLPVGYGSHLALDGLTPKGLPLT